MSKLYKHCVEIGDGSGILKSENKFEVEEVEVLADNGQYLVLSDLQFTTLQHARGDKFRCYPAIGVESICISTRDRCWGNRVTYTLYSFSQKRATTIRKEIEREISDKLGWLSRGIDLSIIKDAGAAPPLPKQTKTKRK